MSEIRTLIIMPAHNEALNISPVIDAIRQHASGIDLLVVNDDSKDGTAEVARRAGAAVITLPCNLGYGGAVQTGFRYAVEHGYEIGLIMDADGQHDAADIPVLLGIIRNGEADLALGSRFLGRLEYSPSWFRHLAWALLRRLASRMTGLRVTDPTSGFQAMTGELMRFFARDNYPTDFPDADTIIAVSFAGFRVKEAPVTMRDRVSGQAMHTTIKGVYYMFKMLLSIFIVWLRRRTNSQALRPGAGGQA